MLDPPINRVLANILPGLHFAVSLILVRFFLLFIALFFVAPTVLSCNHFRLSDTWVHRRGFGACRASFRFVFEPERVHRRLGFGQRFAMHRLQLQTRWGVGCFWTSY